MKKPRRRWILTLLRTALCVAALAYVVTKVSWYGTVRLADGTTARLIEERKDDGSLLIERDGQREQIAMDRVAHRVEGDVRVPDIEYGIRGVVLNADLLYIVGAILIFLPVPLLQSVRLVWMLAIQGVRLSYWESIKLSYAGNFFNFALPGTTGGDLIKAYYITRFTHHKTEAVTTVFLDRVVGLLGLVVLAGVMMAISWNPEQFGTQAIVILVVFAGLAVGAAFVFSRRLRHMIGLPQLAARMPMGAQLLRVGRATIAMRQHKTLVAMALANTVVLQFIVMVSAWVMSLALGMEGGFLKYLIYVPIGFLIAAIPISPPQAFGVMEWAYIQFFVHSGLPNSESQAVTFALAVRLIQLCWALPGVLVPLLGAHLPKVDELRELEVPDDQPATEDAAPGGGGAALLDPAVTGK